MTMATSARLPDGPRGSRLFGVIPEFRRDPLQFLQSTYDRFGPIAGLGVLLSIFLVILGWRRVRGLDRPIRHTLPVVALLVPVYAVTSAALVLHIA